MDDDDYFGHPALGVFKRDGEDGWLGRSDPGPNFFDLYVMRPAGHESDIPPAAALATLEQAFPTIAAVKADAVARVIAARTARLNWRDGPPVDQWSIVEARTDRDGVLWLNLHEYETDEYSRWLVRMNDGAVRRIRAIPVQGPPAEAGEPV